MKITKWLFIIGSIVLLVGIYSMFFKAGLPYQDPTPEMAKEWIFYYNLGEITVPVGTILVLTSIILKMIEIIIRLFGRFNKK